MPNFSPMKKPVKILIFACVILTMTGCSIYRSVDNLINPTDNPNNVEFLNEYDIASLNHDENVINNVELRDKRAEAVNAVLNAIQTLMHIINGEFNKLSESLNSRILFAQKVVNEYQKMTIFYNDSKLKASASKALQALFEAEEYEKQNINDFTKSKLKLALLYLINDRNALWQYQAIDNNIFPDYLKWGDAVSGTDTKSTSKFNPFVFWGKTKFNKKNIVENPNSLVFSGGGAKGLAYVGVLKYLQEKGKLKNVKRFIGTSAGSIICMFISVAEYYEKNRKQGSKPFWELVYKIVEEEKFIDFIENPILNQAVKDNNIDPFTDNFLHSISPVADSLRTQYALCDGTNSLNFFKKSLVKFGFSGDITLKELYEKTGKHLILVSCSLSYKKIAYFDYETAPDLSVAEGMRASMAIPFIFKPVKYNNDFFIDGGVVNNYPINYFDYNDYENGKKSATLGFVLYSEQNMLSPDWNKIGDTVDYTKAVLNIITTNTGSALFKKNVDRTVFIDCGDIDTMSFNMTKAQKNKLMQAGYDAIDKYYTNK